MTLPSAHYRGTDTFTIEAIFDQTPDEVVPEKALQHLPFSAESVHLWSIGGDLGQFTVALHNIHIGALLADGTYNIANASLLGPKVFESAHARALELNKLFERSEPKLDYASAGVAHQLGRALKYFSAWDIMSTAVLEESAFISLPHVLEGSTDLTCAVQLAASYFYKQAAQVLSTTAS